MSETIEKLREKYEKILLSNGIPDKISEVILSDSGAKGDGMASETQCVTVTFKDPKKSPLELFIKVHTQNPSHEAMLNDLKAFEKEARFFMEYLPAAEKLCKSKGLDNLLDFYPKCYYGDENTIILENLVKKGYQLLPYTKAHDFDTAIFALTNLAKHHAISYAMIQECGGDDKFFQRFLNLDHDGMKSGMIVEMMVGSFEQSLQTNAAVLQKHKIDGGDEILGKLKSIMGTTRDIIKGIGDAKKDQEVLLVLNHGDYKNNNMMVLKNKETDGILHHAVIDLQMTSYNSPGLDLCYYLFTSVDSTVRQSKLKELLNSYRDILNKVSRDLGYPIEISYEDLLMQFRRKIKFGVLLGTTLVGPGMALYKNVGIDVTKIEMEDLPKIFIQYLLKWIEDNPEKGKGMAEEIKNLVEELTKYEL